MASLYMAVKLYIKKQFKKFFLLILCQDLISLGLRVAAERLVSTVLKKNLPYVPKPRGKAGRGRAAREEV